MSARDVPHVWKNIRFKATWSKHCPFLEDMYVFVSLVFSLRDCVYFLTLLMRDFFVFISWWHLEIAFLYCFIQLADSIV